MNWHGATTLKAQFRWVFISLMLLLALTGLLAAGLLWRTQEATRRLSEEQLRGQQDAVRLRLLTLEVASNTSRLLAQAATPLDARGYRQVLQQLDEVDALLPNLAANPEDLDALAVYQASQQYRAAIKYRVQGI